MAFKKPVIAEKLVRDGLEEEVRAGDIRKETDSARAL